MTRAGIWGPVGIPQRLIVHVVYISYKSPKNGGAGNTGGGELIHRKVQLDFCGSHSPVEVEVEVEAVLLVQSSSLTVLDSLCFAECYFFKDVHTCSLSSCEAGWILWFPGIGIAALRFNGSVALTSDPDLISLFLFFNKKRLVSQSLDPNLAAWSTFLFRGNAAIPGNFKFNLDSRLFL